MPFMDQGEWSFAVSGPPTTGEVLELPHSSSAITIDDVGASTEGVEILGRVMAYTLDSATKRAIRHVRALVRQFDDDWDPSGVSVTLKGE